VSTLPAYPLALLAVAGTGVFMASATGMTRAPFLLQMARDLDVSLVMVSHLLSVTAVTWGSRRSSPGRWARRSGGGGC